MRHENNIFLLVHTMTIMDYDFMVQAQFFHTFVNDLTQIGNSRLVGKRFSLRLHPRLCRNRNKLALRQPNLSNLRTRMKNNAAVVKHHLRTIHIGLDIQGGQLSPNENNQLVSLQTSLSPKRNNYEKKDDYASSQDDMEGYNNNQLTRYASPDEITTWLTVNRFEKYVETFARFSGADMLRMSRDDLIQICGHADGIRLHNILHSKSIAPKLKIYVCRENSTVFNAVFLTSHNTMELLRKLANLVSVNQDQIRDIYMEGPQSIHVQLTDDMLQHIEDETMFAINVIHQENGGYIFLLKRKIT